MDPDYAVALCLMTPPYSIQPFSSLLTIFSSFEVSTFPQSLRLYEGSGAEAMCKLVDESQDIRTSQGTTFDPGG
jgi:hypothetical protein